ncbi:MAG: HD domain-containing protein [Dehalococcoidia bacterium]|nr:HD domain-containing protein [Dehalococcoidia bacterium]
MASKARIQTVKADFLDPSLYDDTGLSGLPRISRGTLLAPLSRAFDLAEGRKPGHAQRVAYIGVYLANELGLDAARIEEVFFGCLLHDAGMAAVPAAPRVDTARGTRLIAGNASTRDVLAAVPTGGWADVLEALTQHCEHGARIARKLGLGETVARAVAHHHDCWDGSGLPGSQAGDRMPLVSRIVAVADRVESMIDAEGSPLMVRRRGPALVLEMAGSELDPEIAQRMAALAGKDEFWLGFYDNDLPATLMSLNYGGIMNRDELFEFIGALSDVVDGRNGRETGRGRRVAEAARRVALTCDMTERRADLVQVAALLQDIGTLGVSSHVLSKPDILTIDEMAIVQLHPIYARDILSEVPGLGAAAWWVGCHHERIDGKGYPGMLEGDEVPAEAQIIGMCEAFDALTSDRPYRRAMSSADAIEVMRGLAGTRFDPYLFERFESSLATFSAA